MTADSTDRRDELARVIRSRIGPHGEVNDYDVADHVIKHLRATGPARDEGLRERIEALRDEIVHDSLYDHSEGRRAALAIVDELDAALAASPAPGGDEGVRAEVLREAADRLPRDAGLFKVVEDDNERRLVEWCADRLRRMADEDDDPAPGGDTAPREDGESWAQLSRTGGQKDLPSNDDNGGDDGDLHERLGQQGNSEQPGSGVAERDGAPLPGVWAQERAGVLQRRDDVRDGMPVDGLPLRAHDDEGVDPVPPGPAATRDGEGDK